jgi:hypothetical protein
MTREHVAEKREASPVDDATFVEVEESKKDLRGVEGSGSLREPVLTLR